MPSTEIAVLHNPTAGDRDLPRRKLASLLRRAGYQPRFFSLKEQLWKKKHAMGDAKLIVVAGGDGSVRKAVLQLHDLGRPFALLPLGTANNICTSLGIGGTPQKLIASWSRAQRRKIDLGVAEGPWGRRFFIESIGVGLVARTIAIMAKVGATSEHRPEWREDRLHRDASVMQALAHELRAVKFTVSVDAGPARTADYLLLEIMNIRHVGPGLQLAPKADPSDGWLNLVWATLEDREKLKRALAASVAEKKTRTKLLQRKIHRLRLELSEGELRLDDQIVLDLRAPRTKQKKLPVKVDISVHSQACEILTPRWR
jgi:diacylglycerol kinase (ATP)